jgi:hypothetical protein
MYTYTFFFFLLKSQYQRLAAFSKITRMRRENVELLINYKLIKKEIESFVIIMDNFVLGYLKLNGTIVLFLGRYFNASTATSVQEVN